MTVVSAGNALTIDLPGNDWLTCEAADAFWYVRPEELALALGRAPRSPFAISVRQVPSTGSGVRHAAAALMADRGLGECPLTLAAQFDGVPTFGYEYTDGVALIHSYFAECPSGEFVEISIRSAFLDSGEARVPMDSAVQLLLDGLHWNRAWIVWRQDDNGIVDKVATLATGAEATTLVADLESKGHKQLYWVATPSLMAGAAQQAVEADGRASS